MNDPNKQGIVYTTTRSIAPPEDFLEAHRLLAAQGKGSITDAYDFLRTKVIFRMQERGWNVLAVTSPRKGEGKTLTAINLAISLSRKIDSTVLLVDADLANPMVHRFFGLDLHEGLIDYVMNDVPLEKLLIHPDIDRLVLLPGGSSEETGLELLTSPKMLSLVKELKCRYPSRIVIFDLPPLLHTANAMAFSPYIDAILLVVKAGATQQEDVEKALHLLEETPVIGTVLNQA